MSKSHQDPCDDGEVMRIWRQCGLPEYFLGNGGTNHKLVAFAEACRVQREPVTERKIDRAPAPYHRRFSHAFTNEFGNRIKVTVQDAILDGQPAMEIRLDGHNSVTENCVTLREATMLAALLGFMLDMGRLQ